MARYPKIQQNCPVKASIDTYLNDGVCNLCDREVHDIGSLTDLERSDFMASCTDEVCVKYSLPSRRQTSVVALSALLMTLPSAAQESSPIKEHSPVAQNACSTEHAQRCGDINLDNELEWLTLGSIKDPSRVEYIDTEEDLAIPELPVIYEDEINS